MVAGAEEAVRRELSGCMVSKERLHVTLLPLRLGESELEAACARLDAVASKVTGGGWDTASIHGTMRNNGVRLLEPTVQVSTSS